MGRRSREKGKRGEREAAAAVSEALDVDARRGCQYAGTADSPDIVADVPGVHFEVKRREQFRLYEALDQATAEAGDQVPVVLHRANRRPWVAIVALSELRRLAVQLYLSLAGDA
jgi:hypothetical protein